MLCVKRSNGILNCSVHLQLDTQKPSRSDRDGNSSDKRERNSNLSIFEA